MGHIEPSREAGRALLQRELPGAVVMLNLLRFRSVADYGDSPELAPPEPISGQAAYERYVALVTPLLQASGGELLFSGTAAEYLIGPADETWDLALLVRHRSVSAFMSFATDPDYLAVAGHRTAALEDSRLLPLVERG